MLKHAGGYSNENLKIWISLLNTGSSIVYKSISLHVYEIETWNWSLCSLYSYLNEWNYCQMLRPDSNTTHKSRGILNQHNENSFLSCKIPEIHLILAFKYKNRWHLMFIICFMSPFFFYSYVYLSNSGVLKVRPAGQQQTLEISGAAWTEMHHILIIQYFGFQWPTFNTLLGYCVKLRSLSS